MNALDLMVYQVYHQFGGIPHSQTNLTVLQADFFIQSLPTSTGHMLIARTIEQVHGLAA